MFNSLSTIIFLEPLYIIGRAHPLEACGLCLIFFLKKFFWLQAVSPGFPVLPASGQITRLQPVSSYK